MKKLIAIILVAVMILPLAPSVAFAAPEVDNVGKVPADYTPAGTAISSWSELTDAAGTYYLTGNITVDATFASAFTGTLDGNGYTVTTSVPMFEEVQGTVKNLTVAGSVTVSSGFAGAVAKIVKGGTVENVKNTAPVIGAVGGFEYTYLTDTTALPATGGISGVATGNAKFVNCANTAEINSCAAGGIVGVVGYDQSASISFEGCTNSGKVHDAGTLMKTGQADAGVPNCKGEDNALGGIAGFGYEFAALSFKDCANSGDVDSTGSKKAPTGGIFGYSACISANFGKYESTISFEGCSNSANITGSGQTGGIAGWAGYSVLVLANELTNSGTIHSTTSYSGGIFARVSEYAPTEAYPEVNTVKNSSNTGTVESYTGQSGGIVGYAEIFVSAYNCSNSGKVGRTALGTEKNQNLAAGGIIGKVSNVAATLTGVIDNCTNTGEIYAKNQMGGIIGWYGGAGTSTSNEPSSLIITNCVNEGKIEAYGKDAYGAGIVGRVGNDNTPAEATATLTVKDCVNKGTVLIGKDQGAGIIGYNCAHNSTFENCVNYGKITVIPDTESATFAGAAGGIQGGSRNADHKGGLYTFINCKNYGELIAKGGKAAGGIIAVTNSPTEVINCENYGKVTGATDAGAGGIVGRFNSKWCVTQIVKNCYNAGDVYNTNGRLASIVGYSYGSAGIGANITNCVNTGNVESANGVACGIIGYCNASDIIVKNNVIMGTLKGNKAATAIENGAEVKEGNFYSFTAEGKTYYFIAVANGTVTIEGTKVTVHNTNGDVTTDYVPTVFETIPQTLAVVWDNKSAPVEGNISGNVFAEGYADYFYIAGANNSLIADSIVELTGTFTEAQLASGEVTYLLNQTLGETVFYQTIGEDKAPTNRPTSKEVLFENGVYTNPVDPEITEPAPETTEPAPETTEPAPETTEPAPETTEPGSSTPTGDSALIFVMIALIAVLGVAVIAKRREN